LPMSPYQCPDDTTKAAKALLKALSIGAKETTARWESLKSIGTSKGGDLVS
jgi:hypothetical protein